LIVGYNNNVPTTTQTANKYQTALHPYKLCNGPTKANPRLAIIEPEPFMIPVTFKTILIKVMIIILDIIIPSLNHFSLRFLSFLKVL
jgi:hypothetical protein